jgi:hypothetical protein
VAAQSGVADLDFGGVERRDLRVIVSEGVEQVGRGAGAPVDGILGIDFFQGTRLTIDYRTTRLWLATARP